LLFKGLIGQRERKSPSQEKVEIEGRHDRKVRTLLVEGAERGGAITGGYQKKRGEKV